MQSQGIQDNRPEHPHSCTSFVSGQLISSILPVWHALHTLRHSHPLPPVALWQLEAALSNTDHPSLQSSSRQSSASRQGSHTAHPTSSASYQALAGYSNSYQQQLLGQPAGREPCRDPACSCAAAARSAAEPISPQGRAKILQQLHVGLLAALKRSTGGAEPMDMEEGECNQSRRLEAVTWPERLRVQLLQGSQPLSAAARDALEALQAKEYAQLEPEQQVVLLQALLAQMLLLPMTELQTWMQHTSCLGQDSLGRRYHHLAPQSGARCIFVQDMAGAWGCLSPSAVQHLLSSSHGGQLSHDLASGLLQATEQQVPQVQQTSLQLSGSQDSPVMLLRAELHQALQLLPLTGTPLPQLQERAALLASTQAAESPQQWAGALHAFGKLVQQGLSLQPQEPEWLACKQQLNCCLTLAQAGTALESLSRLICSSLACPLPLKPPQRPPKTPKQSLKEMPEASQALFAFMSGPYSTLLKVSSPGRSGEDPASAPAHWEPAALCRVLEVQQLDPHSADVPARSAKPRPVAWILLERLPTDGFDAARTGGVPDVAALAWFQVSVGQPLVPWNMLVASMKLQWPSGQKVAHTTTSGRAHGGKLLDGWSPSSQSEAQLLQHLAAYDVSQARLLLRLAAQACQALRVRWEASQNHVTIVSPWELDFPCLEATPTPAPITTPQLFPHPQASPLASAATPAKAQPSPALSQAAAGMTGQKPPRRPGKHYAPLSHLAEEGLQLEAPQVGQDLGMQDVPIMTGKSPAPSTFADAFRQLQQPPQAQPPRPSPVGPLRGSPGDPMGDLRSHAVHSSEPVTPRSAPKRTLEQCDGHFSESSGKSLVAREQLPALSQSPSCSAFGHQLALQDMTPRRQLQMPQAPEPSSTPHGQVSHKKEASRRRPTKSNTGGYRENWKAKRPRISFQGMQMDVCSACEQPAGTAGMVKCVGVCLQAFHAKCVGLEGPIPQDWWCAQCQSGCMRCAACGEFGTGMNDASMRKCSLGCCGRFYHTKCALELERTAPPKEGGSHFRCPQHYCLRCKGSGDGKDMAKCIRCPNAFHVNCLPADVKRLGSTKPCKVILCSQHSEDEEPRGYQIPPGFDATAKSSLSQDIAAPKAADCASKKEPVESSGAASQQRLQMSGSLQTRVYGQGFGLLPGIAPGLPGLLARSAPGAQITATQQSAALRQLEAKQEPASPSVQGGFGAAAARLGVSTGAVVPMLGVTKHLAHPFSSSSPSLAATVLTMCSSPNPSVQGRPESAAGSNNFCETSSRPPWKVLMQQRHTSSMSRSSFQGLMRGSYLEPGPLSPCKFRPTPQLTLSRPTIAAFAPAAGEGPPAELKASPGPPQGAPLVEQTSDMLLQRLSGSRQRGTLGAAAPQAALMDVDPSPTPPASSQPAVPCLIARLCGAVPHTPPPQAQPAASATPATAHQISQHGTHQRSHQDSHHGAQQASSGIFPPREPQAAPHPESLLALIQRDPSVEREVEPEQPLAGLMTHQASRPSSRAGAGHARPRTSPKQDSMTATGRTGPVQLRRVPSPQHKLPMPHSSYHADTNEATQGQLAAVQLSQQGSDQPAQLASPWDRPRQQPGSLPQLRVGPHTGFIPSATTGLRRAAPRPPAAAQIADSQIATSGLQGCENPAAGAGTAGMLPDQGQPQAAPAADSRMFGMPVHLRVPQLADAAATHLDLTADLQEGVVPCSPRPHAFVRHSPPSDYAQQAPVPSAQLHARRAHQPLRQQTRPAMAPTGPLGKAPAALHPPHPQQYSQNPPRNPHSLPPSFQHSYQQQAPLQDCIVPEQHFTRRTRRLPTPSRFPEADEVRHSQDRDVGLYGEPEPEAYPNPFWAACEDPAACLDEPVPPKLALGDELSREVDRTLAEYCARVGCPPELCQDDDVQPSHPRSRPRGLPDGYPQPSLGDVMTTQAGLAAEPRVPQRIRSSRQQAGGITRQALGQGDRASPWESESLESNSAEIWRRLLTEDQVPAGRLPSEEAHVFHEPEPVHTPVGMMQPSIPQHLVPQHLVPQYQGMHVGSALDAARVSDDMFQSALQQTLQHTPQRAPNHAPAYVPQAQPEMYNDGHVPPSQQTWWQKAMPSQRY